MKPCCPLCCIVLEAEKQFIEAAKRNDVETMTDLGKGLNANVKNAVGLKRSTISISMSPTDQTFMK